MITIKKVDVTPLPENEGKIIDSFNTTDNKHINAPSIDIVETEFNEVNKKIQNIVTGKILNVIENEFVISNGSVSGKINYTNGYTSSNCKIISAYAGETSSGGVLQILPITDGMNQVDSDGVNFYYTPRFQTSGYISVYIVLMKVA